MISNLNHYVQKLLRDTKYLSVFSPNAGKYGPEITPYLDTFRSVFRYNKKVIQAQQLYWSSTLTTSFKIFISKYLTNYFQDVCVITVGSVEAGGSFCGKRIHNWFRSIKSIKEVYFNCYAMQSHVILALLTYIPNCIWIFIRTERLYLHLRLNTAWFIRHSYIL